jgi:hypothetical protein
MRNRHWILFAAFVGLWVAACSSESSDGTNRNTGGTSGGGGTVLTCDDLIAPPLDCGKTCGSNSDCDASFCDSGQCVANCTDEQGCGENEFCNSRGSCVRLSTGGVGGTGGIGVCRDIDVTPTRSIPNVMFLVDQSGSMVEPFGSINRWQAAYDGITSIIAAKESEVRFGLTTYESDDGFVGGATPECPIFGPGADPGPIGFFERNEASAAIGMSYQRDFPGGEDTPTGDSIDALVSWIEDPMNTPPADGPTVIVLVTDGAPDSCEFPDPSNNTERDSARNEVVAAATAAHAPPPLGAGIDTFVLWVGNLSSTSIQNHLKEVANVGIGLDRSTGVPAPSGEQPENPAEGAPFWVGDREETLESALENIIYDSISCEIVIDKPFNPETIQEACDDGVVTLNGNPLQCGVDWQIRNEPPYNVFELLGGVDDPDSACGIFKIQPGAQLEATFPCGTIIVE